MPDIYRDLVDGRIKDCLKWKSSSQADQVQQSFVHGAKDKWPSQNSAFQALK
jgi:hypothetical protein